MIHTMIFLFILNAGLSFGGVVKHPSRASEASKSEATILIKKTAPSLPAVNDLIDGVEVKTHPDILVTVLAPSPPHEADFEETIPVIQINPALLSPKIPMFTDFEDQEISHPENPTGLEPVCPAEADFTE